MTETCGYCGKSLKGYSWADVYTHMKEKHKISILDNFDEELKDDKRVL